MKIHPATFEIGLEYGSMVGFHLKEDGVIEIKAALGANVAHANITSYYADFAANVAFAKGDFRLSDIKIAAIK
ncbi:MAG: hypothetical protein FWF87_07620 [Synergistaceae bacterium]|nr:hypothetical protein [Synergistaceae bacterium]